MVRCHAIIVEAVSRNFPRTKHGVELHPARALPAGQLLTGDSSHPRAARTAIRWMR
jgi:hypothetical protein